MSLFLEFFHKRFTKGLYFQSFFTDTFYDMMLDLGKSDLSNSATFLAPRIRCRQERPSNESPDFSKEDLIEFLPTVEISFWPDEVT